MTTDEINGDTMTDETWRRLTPPRKETGLHMQTTVNK
jgi:hypothetical protein